MARLPRFVIPDQSSLTPLIRVYQTNINKAIQYWQRSLQYDPDHVQAGLRLEQAQRIQQKLKAIK